MHSQRSVNLVATVLFLNFLVAVGALSVAGIMMLKWQIAEMDKVVPPKKVAEVAVAPNAPMIDYTALAEAARKYEQENPPAIQLEFGASQVSLADSWRKISDADEAKMEIEDFSTEVGIAYEEAKMTNEGKVIQYHPSQNRREEYTTSAGTFAVVSCYGRFSANGEGHNHGGMRHDVFVAPSGGKYRMFPVGPNISNIFEVGGKTFIVSSHQILEWSPDTERPFGDRVVIRVVSEGPAYISGVEDQFIRVAHSSASIFGGLLVPDDENAWRFVECPIKGTMVRGAEKQADGKILLTAWDGDPLVFDPESETFEKFAAK
ncbi:MAG: hypothetical protein Q7S57_03030 [bacterium]|nr:hypothetical protein [bacterium]